LTQSATLRPCRVTGAGSFATNCDHILSGRDNGRPGTTSSKSRLRRGVTFLDRSWLGVADKDELGVVWLRSMSSCTGELVATALLKGMAVSCLSRYGHVRKQSRRDYIYNANMLNKCECSKQNGYMFAGHGTPGSEASGASSNASVPRQDGWRSDATPDPTGCYR
jgi:hypothetical protein